MKDGVRLGVWLLLAAWGSVTAAHAQTSPARGDAPDFLSAYRFHITAAVLADEDPRFEWDASIGGDVDLIDYGRGRLTFLANYHIVLGNELQLFDPNQADYTFDLSSSYRLSRAELFLYLHHVSRHLGDRPKLFGVDWNALGTRVTSSSDRGRLEMSTRGQLEYIYKSDFVDYEFMLEGDVAIRYPTDRRVSTVAGGSATLALTDEDVAGRSHVTGAIGHIGLRLEGSAAALELFVALERRIDPYPLSRGTAQWALAGFRLMSR